MANPLTDALEGVKDFLGDRWDAAEAYVDKGLEFKFLKELGFNFDNASANPNTAEVVVTGTEPTGAPANFSQSVMQNWPMWLALLVVVVAVVLLLARLF